MAALTVDAIRQSLADACDATFPDALYACVFGSVARDDGHMGSDLDIGLLLPGEPDLMTLGRFAGDVEERVGRRVDLVLLDGLPMRRPALAYRVATDGVPIVERDREAVIRFRTAAILAYLDTEHLRTMVAGALNGRIARGELGRRDYVRED